MNPPKVETLQEYGLRFDIEENFLDDKSNGFQLESSLIRSAKALERLCFVLAMTTLYLVSVGTDVVKRGKRRLVGSALVSGLELFEDWLEVGELCPASLLCPDCKHLFKAANLTLNLLWLQSNKLKNDSSGLNLSMKKWPEG